jgi:hypothetical protein
VDLTKEHIEKFPRYDEDRMKSESDWKDYEDRYKQGWDEAPVQHQEGRLDLNVTPADVSGIAPKEVRAQRDVNVPMGSMGEEVSDIRDVNTSGRAEEDLAGRDLTPQRLAGKFPTPIQGSQKISMSPSHVEERDYDQARVGSERVPDRAWEDNPTGSTGRGGQVPSREGELVSGSQELDRQSANREIGPQSGYNEDVVHQHSRFNESNVPRVDQTDLDRDRQLLDRDRLEVHRADAGQWHPRMKRFEDVLRKNRVDVTASCASCAAAKKDEAA